MRLVQKTLIADEIRDQLYIEFRELIYYTTLCHIHNFENNEIDQIDQRNECLSCLLFQCWVLASAQAGLRRCSGEKATKPLQQSF